MYYLVLVTVFQLLYIVYCIMWAEYQCFMKVLRDEHYLICPQLQIFSLYVYVEMCNELAWLCHIMYC